MKKLIFVLLILAVAGISALVALRGPSAAISDRPPKNPALRRAPVQRLRLRGVGILSAIFDQTIRCSFARIDLEPEALQNDTPEPLPAWGPENCNELVRALQLNRQE